jgi:hypothetical protein
MFPQCPVLFVPCLCVACECGVDVRVSMFHVALAVVLWSCGAVVLWCVVRSEPLAVKASVELEVTKGGGLLKANRYAPS